MTGTSLPHADNECCLRCLALGLKKKRKKKQASKQKLPDKVMKMIGVLIRGQPRSHGYETSQRRADNTMGFDLQGSC